MEKLKRQNLIYRGGIQVEGNRSTRQFQDDFKQYQMPDSVKQQKTGPYRVGFESNTGIEKVQNQQEGSENK